MQSSDLEKTERITNITRNILVIAAWIVAAGLLVFFLPRANLVEFSALGFKLALGNQLNDEARINGEQDVEAAGAPKDTARLIDTKENSFWVYVGETERGSTMKWLFKSFDITTVPQNGNTITAKVDVFKRASQPRFDGKTWIKGEIIGLLPRETETTVEEIFRIDGAENKSLWWARVGL